MRKDLYSILTSGSLWLAVGLAVTIVRLACGH